MKTKDRWSRWADALAGDWKANRWQNRECYIPAVDTYMKSENGMKFWQYVEKQGRKRLFTA